MTTAERLPAEQRLLAEDLLLLAWNDEAGRPATSTSGHLSLAVGGALLADLALRDRLRMEVDVPRASTRPTGNGLLDDVAAQLREGSRRRKLAGWVRRVGRATRREEVRDRLVTAGLLVTGPRVGFGPMSLARHHLADAAAVAQLAEEVRGVLVEGRPGTPRTLALAGLVGSTAVLNTLVERTDRREARRRATAITDNTALPGAAREVLRATRSVVRATAATAGVSAGS